MVKVKKRKFSNKQTNKQNITRDIEIKNKLTLPRGEVGGDNGGKRGKGCQEHVYRTHGRSQRGIELRVGGGNGCGRGEW